MAEDGRIAYRLSMANVKPHPPGQKDAWRIRVSAGPDPSRPGKYRVISEIFRGSERKARLRAAELEVDILRREGRTAAGATFAQLLDMFIEDCRTAGLSRRTIVSYQGHADQWLKPKVGSVPVTRLTNVDLTRVYAAMRTEGMSPASIERVNATARAALNKAITWGWITANPTKGVTRPPVRAKRIKPPTVEQLYELVRVATESDPAMGVVLLVSAALGSRRGETCALRWQDVDLENGVIHIEHSIDQLTKADGGWALKDTKTHAERDVDIPDATVEILRAHGAMMEARFGMPVQPTSFVFSAADDLSEPLWPDRLTGAFRRSKKAAGIDARLHDLRHLNATLLADAGVDKWTIVERLGWANAAMFDKVYGHAMPGSGSGKAAATALGNRLTGVSETTALPSTPATTNRQEQP